MPTLASLMDMHGRRAVVTGAAGAIGRVICHTLAELGADLVMVDRSGAQCDAVRRELVERWSRDVLVEECDLEQESERAALVTRLRGLRRLDVLVNNAAFVGTTGLDGWVTDFEHQSVSTWRRAMEVNLTAGFDLCKGLAPMLGASGEGSIINVASIYGFVGPDYSLYADTAMGNPAAYAASKGGLIQLSRWLSATLAPAIRVNSLSPGGVFRNQPEVFVRRYEQRTPLRRMAVEDDFRGAVAFLASRMSSYVTGQNLIVDGGWSVL